MISKKNTNINSIEEAIKQLEDLKRDRLSFVNGDKEHDEIYLKDVQAINMVLSNLKIEKNIIDDLKREKEENKEIIAMAQNDMLGYYQGYSDGKSLNRSATAQMLENREYYIHERKTKQLKCRIKELEEENLHWRGQYYLVTRKIGVLPKQKIKDAIEKIAEYKIARETNKGYYYDYFINQDYKEDFIKLFNKLLED